MNINNLFICLMKSMLLLFQITYSESTSVIMGVADMSQLAADIEEPTTERWWKNNQ
jgi:hypothetical protein